MSALDIQVGGDHYKTKAMQPVELWAALNLNGFQASIVKYITRHKEKNGAADIDKAEHFFELAEETGVDLRAHTDIPVSAKRIILKKYYADNGLDRIERLIISTAIGFGPMYKLPELFESLRTLNGYPVNGEG